MMQPATFLWRMTTFAKVSNSSGGLHSRAVSPHAIPPHPCEHARALFSAASSSDDEEETAEQKRLRVAKQYLDDMRRAEAAEEDEADREGHADALGDRLRRAADLESGAVFRRVADAVGARLGGADVCSGSGRLFRGHRLAVTGVCLLPSAERGFSVGKDGKVIGWDIESGKRTIFPDADPKVLSKVRQQRTTGTARHDRGP